MSTMMMKRLQTAVLALALLFVLGCGLSVAQEHAALQPQTPAQENAQQNPPQGAKGREAAEKTAYQGNMNTELAKASREAAAEGEETAQFKESPSVRFIASITGLSPKSAYWLAIAVNFAILAVLIVLFSKSKLPAMFRTRTGEIQRGIAEARKASEEANRRLANVESRLMKLDAEVAEMRVLAQKEAAVEEDRIRQATEEDKRKVVSSANAEIAAAAKLARRDLRAYTADLAIQLAEKRIRIDAETDRALVSNFVEQLNDGKNGR